MIEVIVLPCIDPDKRKAYAREWIKARRDAWIAQNGPCIKCGSSDKLEVDHINPSEKVYAVGGIWSACAEKREAELIKCQVLCHSCHVEKTHEYRERLGLTTNDIQNIRLLYDQEGMTYQNIAKRYKVGALRISKIVKRITWKDVL
jgi:hypothetical protein